jgi:hypothetical protein
MSLYVVLMLLVQKKKKMKLEGCVLIVMPLTILQ